MSSAILNGLVLGAATAGVAYFGGNIDTALKGAITSDGTGIAGFADKVLEALGSGFQYASTNLNSLGKNISGAADDVLPQINQLDENVRNAIATGLSGALAIGGLTVLGGAVTGSQAPASTPTVPGHNGAQRTT